MKTSKPKKDVGIRWAYYAPDGYIQVRTIAFTRTLAREHLPAFGSDKTWIDYEEQGFYLRKVTVNTIPLD